MQQQSFLLLLAAWGDHFRIVIVHIMRVSSGIGHSWLTPVPVAIISDSRTFVWSWSTTWWRGSSFVTSYALYIWWVSNRLCCRGPPTTLYTFWWLSAAAIHPISLRTRTTWLMGIRTWNEKVLFYFRPCIWSLICMHGGEISICVCLLKRSSQEKNRDREISTIGPLFLLIHLWPITKTKSVTP